MTDDQGYGDLSVMGNPVLDTPHIDSSPTRGLQWIRLCESGLLAYTGFAHDWSLQLPYND